MVRKDFLDVLNNYLAAKQGVFADHPLEATLRRTLPESIMEILRKEELSSELQAFGSAGKGNWASVPWVAILHRQETSSPQQGVYVVYLFAADMSALYLTLNQGVTKTSNIDANREEFFQRIGPLEGFSQGPLPKGSLASSAGRPRSYENACIYYKHYTPSRLPDEEELTFDLLRLVRAYVRWKGERESFQPSMERKYFAIAITSREWFEKALSGRIDVLQFPPSRRPNLGHMKEGDYVLVLTRKDKKFVGELRFKEARFVSHGEFEEEFKERAYEVKESPFVSPGQSCWVMVFDEVIKYKDEVDKDKVMPFPILGFSPLSDKHWDKRENCRNLGGIGEIVEPKAKKDIHAELTGKIKEIGEFLGKWAKEGYHSDLYIHDVIWKPYEDAPRASHAFEVHHKGNLQEALLRLKHAQDIWGCDIFIVVTEEMDKEKARHSVSPFLKGALHEIGETLQILSSEEIFQIHRALGKHKELLITFIKGRKHIV